MSFSSCCLVTCTSLRTLFKRLSNFKSISFTEASSKHDGTLAWSGSSGLDSFSSLIDCRLRPNASNSLGSPTDDKPSASHECSLSDDIVLQRPLPLCNKLEVRNLEWKSTEEQLLSRGSRWEGRMEWRLSNATSWRNASSSFTCFSMTLTSPVGTLIRTSPANQVNTTTLTQVGISQTEGLL